MKFKEQYFKEAIQHERAKAVLLKEADGSRLLRAIDKAEIELAENPTIEFADGVLSFYSRSTGLKRIVTKFGCHSSCECGNAISYHRALYLILTEYSAISVDIPSSVYLKPALDGKTTQIGGIRF